MACSRPNTTFQTACFAAITVCATTTAAIVYAVQWLWRESTIWLTERIASVAARVPPSTDWSEPYRPSVLLVRARAFVDRMAHRELRHITPGWRACPSI